MKRRHRWLSVFVGVLMLLVGRASGAPPQSNVVYEIFVRSFYQQGGGGHVGTLKGVQEKLKYMSDGDPATHNDLGVGIIWLMPIFPSKSYHGYDVTDYRAVNPEYGSLADLDDLITAAHSLGMRIILDIPFNHTSTAHPWFQDAIEDKNGRRDFYLMYPDDGHSDGVWHTTVDSHGNRLKYFGQFDASMPDLNFDNPAVRTEIKSIAKFWLDRHIDGFRLDAAKHIYGWTGDPNEGEIQKDNQWWREFSDAVYQQSPKAILVGEVLGGADLVHRFAWGLNGLIDEPFMKDARNRIAHPNAGFLGRWKGFLKSSEDENAATPFDSFPYLASHDENPRLASWLEKEMPDAADAGYRLGMSMLMTLGKYPIIYNGDEIGQRGWKWNGNGRSDKNPGDGTGVYDETLRESLPWYKTNVGQGQTDWQPPGQPGFLPKFYRANDGISVEEENGDGASMLNFVRALGNLHTEVAALDHGEMGQTLEDSADWMVFERGGGADTVLVLMNSTGQGKDYKFHAQWHAEYRGARLLFWSDGRGRQWKDLTAGNDVIGESVFVAPYGMVILKKVP